MCVVCASVTEGGIVVMDVIYYDDLLFYLYNKLSVDFPPKEHIHTKLSRTIFFF